jgi:hypothetical protein
VAVVDHPIMGERWAVVDREEELLVRLVEQQDHQLAVIQVVVEVVLLEMELQQEVTVVPVS